MKFWGWQVSACAVVLAFAGCKSPPHGNATGPIAESARTTEVGTGVLIDPSTTGTIEGTVHFAGKPPDRLKIDMSQDPACAMAPGENLAEQYVVHDGGLANVYVYIKSGPPIVMGYVGQTLAPVVLDQKGCRYVPHVIAVMVGGTVEFRNSDGTMHNIHTMPSENPGIDVSQGPRGAPERKRFDKPETMIPVRCNNHPWMNAFINVSATPFFAVTDSDGRFEIKGLPAGTYTLAAVHEKMGEQTISIKIASKESAKAEFTYSMK
jgi:plastocyanin